MNVSFFAIIKGLFILYLLVGLGFMARKKNLLARDASKQFNSFLYYFSLPALFLYKVGTHSFQQEDVAVIMYSVLPIVSMVSVLTFLKLIGVLRKRVYVLLCLSVVFASNTFFGVPFFDVVMGGGRGFEYAIIAAAVLGPVGIVLTTLLFEYATGAQKGVGLFLRILTRPLIISVILGAIVSWQRLDLGVVGKVAQFLGQAAPAIALFSLGMFMHDVFSWDAIKKSIWFVLFRAVGFPCVVFLLIMLTHLERGLLFQFVLLQAGLPAAISLTVFSQKYNFEKETFAGIVLLSSLVSMIVLLFLSLIVI